MRTHAVMHMPHGAFGIRCIPSANTFVSNLFLSAYQSQTVLKDSSVCLREFFPSFGGASLVLMLACSFCCSVKQQTGLIQHTGLHNYTTYWADITQRTGLTTYWADTMHWVDTTYWVDSTYWVDTMHLVDTTYWVDTTYRVDTKHSADTTYSVDLSYWANTTYSVDLSY